MQAHCVGCHHTFNEVMADGGTWGADGGGVTFGMLDLGTVDAAYQNLIDVPAQGILPAFEDAGQIACDTLDAGTAGHIRVVPGDAGESLLCLKLKGWLNDGATPPPCGIAMPANGPIPDGGQQAAFTAVQQWINEGANP